MPKTKYSENDYNEVIAQITWTVQDVRNAFNEKHGRFPTDHELETALDSLNTTLLAEVGIAAGWDIIYPVVW